MKSTIKSIEIRGRIGYGVYTSEFINGLDAVRELVWEIRQRNLRCADLAALLDLERAVPQEFCNTGVIWALGPFRDNMTGIMSTVVYGLCTDHGNEGIVQAGISIYGIGVLARHSFLVRQAP